MRNRTSRNGRSRDFAMELAGNLPGVLAGALAGVLVGLVVGGALPGLAAAQERIQVEIMPDLAFEEPALPRPRSAKDGKARVLWDVGAALGQALRAAQGAGDDRSGPFSEGYLRLRWGQRWSLERVAQLRSALQLYGREIDTISAGDSEAQGFVDGRHRARAAFGFEPRARGKAPPMDIGLGIEGSFDHMTENRPALAPLDVGPGAHRDARVRVDVAPRFFDEADDSEHAGFAIPITIAGRRVDHAEPAGVDSATSRRLGIGVAARMVDRKVARLDVTLMGMERAQTTYDLAPLPGAPMPPGPLPERPPERLIDENTLYFGKLDLAIGDAELAVSARGQTGWTWLRDPRTDRNTNLFTIDYGLQLSGDSKRVGLGFGRVARVAVDGERFYADHRLELDMEWTAAPTGGSVRAVASWMTDRDRTGSMDPGLLERYAAHGEIHRALESGLHVGFYGVSAYEPDGQAWAAGSDPWATPAGWNHELGGFARWSGEL
jgi:hypothetical protein